MQDVRKLSPDQARGALVKAHFKYPAIVFKSLTFSETSGICGQRRQLLRTTMWYHGAGHDFIHPSARSISSTPDVLHHGSGQVPCFKSPGICTSVRFSTIIGRRNLQLSRNGLIRWSWTPPWQSRRSVIILGNGLTVQPALRSMAMGRSSRWSPTLT